MAHARQTLREAIAALLRTAPANWGSVLETRIVPTRQIWPFLMVYVTEETAEQMLIHPSGIYDRSASVSVVGMLKMPGTGDGSAMGETVEDRMDAMAAEVETRLTLSALQGSVAKAKTLALASSSMDVITNEADGSISHAELTMTWTVTYDTVEGAPETLI
jgi:hypothetical protein